MPPTRLLASLATGALVAVPGFALAQGGPPAETPPVQAPPEDRPAAPELPEIEEPEDVEQVEEEEEVEEVEEAEVEEVEELDEDDEDGGHGQAVSALAGCLPSGAELHGTGITKGHVMSQAASTGLVELLELGLTRRVETAEQATALCEALATAIDDREVPETAKGRPHWAGPKGEDGQVEGAEAGGTEKAGPPADAGQGKGKGTGTGPDEARGRG